MAAIRLTDAQLVALSAASQRQDRGFILPGHLKGGAAHKMVAKLISLKLLEEIHAFGDLPTWRRGKDNRPMALRITKRGLNAIAVEPAPEVSRTAASASTRRTRPEPMRASPGTEKARRLFRADRKGEELGHSSGGERATSKQAIIIDLLRRSEGADIAAMMKATGWQQHSVRGFLAGTVRKKLGLELVSEQVGSERVYRIVAHASEGRSKRKSARRAR